MNKMPRGEGNDIQIQIQHLLKLNSFHFLTSKSSACYSNTTLVKVKF